MHLRKLIPIKNIYRAQPSVIFFNNRRHFSYNSPEVHALIKAVEIKDYSAITKLAKQHPRLIVEQTSNDNSALHEAAKKGDVEAIRTLQKDFSKDFNVNHKCHCRLKRTPLHYAVENHHFDATQELLKMGADPNITDERGRTALDYSLERNNERLQELIKSYDGVSEKYKVEVFEEKFKKEQAAKMAKLEADFIERMTHPTVEKTNIEITVEKSTQIDKKSLLLNETVFSNPPEFVYVQTKKQEPLLKKKYNAQIH